jgi:hypothetical protein
MSDLQRTLRDLHRELGEAHRLDPDERAMLESVASDIQRALGQPVEPVDPVVAVPPAPGDALEGVAVRLEAEHPGLAGAVRAVVDALAKAGI